MLRRTISSALLGLSVLGGTALAAAPAHAEGTCTLAPPARVVINAPDTFLDAPVTGDCTASGNQAFWYSFRTDEDKYGTAYFDADDAPAYVYFDDNLVEYGVSTWRGEGAGPCPDGPYEDNCDEFTQSATGTSDVRRAAVAGIAGSRSGGTVNLAGSSFVYSTSANRQVHRSAAGTWQVQDRTATTWRSVRNVTTPTSGVTRITFTGQPAGRKYRFVLPATSTSWTGISKTVAP